MVVTAEAPLLNTETAGLEYTLERKLIEDLPSGERSTLALINTMPGVIDQGFALAQGENLNTNGNAQGPIGSPGNRNFFDSSFSASGGQASTNDVLLDGVSDTIADFNGVAISPPQDSVEEFKVLAGVFSAEYGRSGGAIVNFVTKSGTMRFHGSLYDYFQNGALNANGWQRNRAGYGADGVTPRLPRIDVGATSLAVQSAALWCFRNSGGRGTPFSFLTMRDVKRTIRFRNRSRCRRPGCAQAIFPNCCSPDWCARE
jgi:Outer membrane receptor for ferrienterochelin and colicins